MARLKRTDITPGVLIQVRTLYAGDQLLINPHTRTSRRTVLQGEVLEALSAPRRRRNVGGFMVRVQQADGGKGEMLFDHLKRTCALLDPDTTLYKILKPPRPTSWERLATTCLGDDA